MPNPPALEAVRRSLLSHGIAPVYVARLVGELADHRDDLLRELLEAGADPSAARVEADRRMGAPATLADHALRSLRRRSLVGRHPMLSFVLVPLLLVPLIWMALLLAFAAVTGSLSDSHRVGSLTHGDRELLRSVCCVCDWVVPAVCVAIVYTLGRRRACGRVWPTIACLIIATLLAFLSVSTRTTTSGAVVVSIMAVLVPNIVVMIPPLLTAAAIELWVTRRARREPAVS